MHVAAEKDFQRPAIFSPDAHEMRLIGTLAIGIPLRRLWLPADWGIVDRLDLPISNTDKLLSRRQRQARRMRAAVRDLVRFECFLKTIDPGADLVLRQ